MRKLNIGCGDDYKESNENEEWINVDSSQNVRCDKVMNLENIPYDFPDNTFDFIYAKHVIEHISRDKFIDVMRELHRIAKPDAMIHLILPYNKFWNDPTHKNPTTPETFHYFSDPRISRIYNLPKFEVIKERITSDNNKYHSEKTILFRTLFKYGF